MTRSFTVQGRRWAQYDPARHAGQPVHLLAWGDGLDFDLVIVPEESVEGDPWLYYVEEGEAAKSRGQDDYGAALRAACRGLFTGLFDRARFRSAMMAAVRVGQARAFLAGTRLCGIERDEWSDREKEALLTAITYEFQWIEGLGDFVVEQRELDPERKALTPAILNRLKIWEGRFDGLTDKAQMLACADRKFEWVLGEAEHCRSCLKLAGKVKRGSYWIEKGVLPRVHDAGYLD